MSDIDRLLSVDPLADAERVTGKSYKEDKGTMALGFLMHLDHSAKKDAALKQADDSWFSMDLAQTLSLYDDMGFEEVLCDTFAGRTYEDEPTATETYRILWHPKGILATVESYRGAGRNAAKIYYNVDITGSTDWHHATSSGSIARSVTDRKVWVGDHDAREGVRRAIERLGEVGEFLPVWVKRPFLWFLTYTDTDEVGYDYAAITEERTSRLPQHVQQAIAGAEVSK